MSEQEIKESLIALNDALKRRNNPDKVDKQAWATLAGLAFLVSLPAAWITHVVVCINAANYTFLIAGAIAFPIGVIHGYGVWIGAW